MPLSDVQSTGVTLVCVLAVLKIPKFIAQGTPTPCSMCYAHRMGMCWGVVFIAVTLLAYDSWSMHGIQYEETSQKTSSKLVIWVRDFAICGEGMQRALLQVRAVPYHSSLVVHH